MLNKIMMTGRITTDLLSKWTLIRDSYSDGVCAVLSGKRKAHIGFQR